MPEISVVMPVYNGEEYLPGAVESILNQTYGDFEFLIVCEHGTSNKSLDIIEKYREKDLRIKPIYNSERLGISASLNVGLKAATGKYIARMDGDDISGSRRFEIQKLFLESYPEIGVCGTSHTVIRSPNWPVDYVADPEQNRSELLFFAVMRHPSIMFHRELAEGCRYDETLAGAEDYDFYDKLSCVTKLSNVMDPTLFAYRRTGSNASRTNYARDTFIRRETQRKVLNRQLGLDFTDHQMDVLNLMGDVAYETLLIDQPQKIPSEEQGISVLTELDQLLGKIQAANDRNVYCPDCLEQTLTHRWFREKYKLNRVYKKKIPNRVMKFWSGSRFYSQLF